MAEIPGDPNVLSLRRAQHGQRGGPVVAARRTWLDEVSAHPIARRADAVPDELAVVLPGQHVVTRRGEQVEPPPICPAVRRALEAAEEEAPRHIRAEERRGYRHRTARRQRQAE